MLIRSQDKKILVNLSNIKNIYVGGNAVTAYYSDTDYDTLGFYSSDEKAIKVLDMIQNAYLSQERIGQIYTEQCGVIDHGFVGLTVFQMPQDTKVGI